MINYLNGNGDTLTPDAQGRVVIASSLVAFAGLGGATVIDGCFDHAEIWPENVFVGTTPEQADFFAQRYEEADLI
jgi:DNA-binding transcriptional regulator/RsmH inhibitor MraZ